MKRIAALAITSSLIWTMMLTQPANATTQPAGPCIGYGVNKQTPTLVRTTRMKALVRCAFTWAGIGGEIPMALAIVDRESGFIPWAANPWTAAACRPWSGSVFGSCGLAQHLARYWPTRVRSHLKAWWFPKTFPEVSPYNERANALVTALMVRSGGWGPWAL